VRFVDVDTRPTGLGEIGNPFIAPAIANALFKLTGKRLDHMPFTPERVQQALKA
jgi:isoquinoline 1-oxidoreductase beta subunit